MSKNPNLTILNVSGNNLSSIDVTANRYLTHLNIRDNNVSEIDLSKNPNLYLVDIANNNFTFATLPDADPNWGEYYYFRSPLPCDRSYEVGTPVDFSSDVLRPNTQTSVRVFGSPYDGEKVELDKSVYSYEDGKVTFNEVPSDSVFIEFANSAFEMYTLQSGMFKVKSHADMGRPSNVAVMNVLCAGKRWGTTDFQRHIHNIARTEQCDSLASCWHRGVCCKSADA